MSDDFKLIPLTRDKFSKVDIEDFDFLSSFKWNAHFDGYNWYACRVEQKNQGPRPGSSKFKGVSWNTQKKCWIAQIQIDGKKMHLGHFKDEIEAAKAFDEASKRLNGEFAYVNFR